MGVDRQQSTSHTATSSRESSVKRAKAAPAVGIYRPPAARRLDGQVIPSPTEKPSSETVERKLEKTRPTRQRRPDIQVYVPRAKRLLASNGTSASCISSSSQQALSRSCSTGENLLSASQHNHNNRLFDQRHNCGLGTVPPIVPWPNGKNSDVTQRRQSPGIFNDQISHKEKQNKDGVQMSTENVQLRDGKSTDLGENNCLTESENIGIARGVTQVGTPRHNPCNTLTSVQGEGQMWGSDCHYTCLQQETAISPEDCETMLGNFSECSMGEVGYPHKGSKSSSCSTTPRQNSPLAETDGQTWDYFSEIKNATNRAHHKVVDYGTDSFKCNSLAEDSRCVDESLVTCEKSDTPIKCCDNSDQFPNYLDRNSENTKSSILSDNFPSSEDDTKADHQSEDKSCSDEIFTSSECKKNSDECTLQEEQNRKNRRIIRGNFMSDVLIISDPDPVASENPPEIESSSEKSSSPDRVLTKKKKVRHRGESASIDPSQSPEEQNSSASSKDLNRDECTWEMLFDDNGDCLDPKLMDELTNAVGSVAIEKPQSDYRSYQNRVELLMSGAADDEFSHVLEIYNFPPEFKTSDLYAVFSPYMKGGFEIKWVDDTHALGVFSSSLVAAEVLAADHPFVKTRPLHLATHESRLKARRSAEFLQPYRARPETCMALARRLVTGALGVRLNTTPEEREAERKLLKEAREKKKLAARQRDEAWEGTLGEK